MTDKTANTVKLKAVDDMDSLKGDLNALREDLKSVMGNVKDLAAIRANDGVEKGKELASTLGTKAEKVQSDLETRVRENPLAAVGIAFGAGLILAMMRRK